MHLPSLAVVTALVAGVAAGATGDRLLRAQQPANGITRTVLQRADVPGAPGKEVILSLSEFAPGASSARHMHPGGELAYILEGGLVAEIGGKPAATVKAGASYVQPPAIVHEAKNASATAKARAIACTVVDKGQPASVTVP